MTFPSRILDLHTHLFNARYIPLASVIANAMDRDHSPLSDRVAALLEELTGSSYAEPELSAPPADAAAQQERLLETIWNITHHELLAATGSLDAIGGNPAGLHALAIGQGATGVLGVSRLVSVIAELSQVDYAAEGWPGDAPATLATHPQLAMPMQLNDFLPWARDVVKKALKAVIALMDPEAWGHPENYLEFFLTMLKSEQGMVDKLFAGYGSGLPPLQVVHFMMDMQMAYAGEKAPRYPFHPLQLENMQLMQRANPGRVFGFSAFDPRREAWRELAIDALARGFLGFKFYPAMGYTPTGNPALLQSRIDEFFDFCVERDVPIFMHCTPQGFQTRHKLGWNADPQLWRSVLANGRWSTLRLCFGHAGGGRMKNQGMKSPGWMADSDAEWKDPNNFARVVAELCVAYPNVYCEMGYLTEVFKPQLLEAFLNNIERARAIGGKYDFLDKVAYGTDWHMPDMVDNTRKYLDAFLAIMDRAAYRDHREAFFWKNAYRYLKLPE